MSYKLQGSHRNSGLSKIRARKIARCWGMFRESCSFDLRRSMSQVLNNTSALPAKFQIMPQDDSTKLGGYATVKIETKLIT